MKNLPSDYTSLRMCRIACSLFLRTDEPHRALAMKYQIIAPPRMRRKRLETFIRLEAAKKEKKIQKALSKRPTLAPLELNQKPAACDGQNQNTE